MQIFAKKSSCYDPPSVNVHLPYPLLLVPPVKASIFKCISTTDASFYMYMYVVLTLYNFSHLFDRFLNWKKVKSVFLERVTVSSSSLHKIRDPLTRTEQDTQSWKVCKLFEMYSE